MKLSIRSDIILGLKSLLQSEYDGEYRIFFGKMFRTGFTPFLNKFDYDNIANALQGDHEEISERHIGRVMELSLDIGLLLTHYIVIGKSEETESDVRIETVYSSHGSYQIALISDKDQYSVEIIFPTKPVDIFSLFIPVKYLLQICSNTLNTVQNRDDIVSSYNSLFGKDQNRPCIIRQPLLRLSESFLPNLNNYLVFPIPRGEKYTLLLCKSGAYLLSRDNILNVAETVPPTLYNTVVTGYLYEKSFYGYDVAMIAGKDIRRISLLRRLNGLSVVSKYFTFCQKSHYIHGDLEFATTCMLQKYDGVLYAPINANFMNNRRYIYQPVDKTGINFLVVSRKTNGYQTYELKVGQGETVFCGSDNYPMYNTVPLSQEDREFVGMLGGVFEFRWESDGFIPYAYSSIPSSVKQARNLWNSINEPLDLQLLMSHIRTFKKTKTTKKDN